MTGLQFALAAGFGMLALIVVIALRSPARGRKASSDSASGSSIMMTDSSVPNSDCTDGSGGDGGGCD